MYKEEIFDDFEKFVEKALDWEIILVIDLGFIGLRVGDGRNFGKGFGGCFDCFKKGG